MNEITNKQYYNKVDFTNPASVVSYGQELLEEMGSFMNNVSVMTDLGNSDDFNVEDILRKINDFGKYLDKSKPSEKIEKKFLAPVPSFIKTSFIEAKEKIFGTESYSTTFSEAYKEINEDLDAISDNIDFKAKNAMKRIEISKSFSSKMEEYVIKLEDLIKSGEEDLDEYTSGNEELDELIKNLVTLFQKRLDSLNKSLIVFKNSILESKMKISNDYELLMQYQEYKTSALSVLRNQATDMITTKHQRDDLEEQRQLNEITNNALINNAKTIKSNTQKVNELKEKGTIETDTLKSIVNYTKEGLRLLEQGQNQEAINSERDKKILESISAELDEISTEVKNLAETKTNVLTMKKEG